MRSTSGGQSRIDPRSRWMAARARTALRRPGLIAAVSGAAFVAALVALVLVPRGATRSARAAAPRAEDRPDTIVAASLATRAQLALAATEAQLASARATTMPRALAIVVDTFSAEAVARRDSLAAGAAALSRLLARAEGAPLPASYRALGEARELRADAGVRSLLDSLADAEREREAFGAVGGADPIFVALTSRVTEIGRAIQSIAERRHAEMRRSYAVLRPAPLAPPAAIAIVDTMPYHAAVDAARRESAIAGNALRREREAATEFTRRLERARERANIGAPPVAMLAAALVLGLGCGFSTALAREFRNPTVADAREAEAIGGARVLGVVRAETPSPDRTRRRADLAAPPLIDPTSSTYRMLYLHFAATGSRLPLVTMTGDEPDVLAVVSANLAAAAAYEARATLLVDADVATSTLAALLRLRPGLGVAGVLAGTIDWPEAIVTTTIGRDRSLDVIPAGAAARRGTDLQATEEQRRDLARLARRYDLVVLVAPAARAGRVAPHLLPAPDVVVCARVAFTTLAALASLVEELRSAGTRVRGIVLWDGVPPAVPTLDAAPPALDHSRDRAGTRAAPSASARHARASDERSADVG